jgi:plastocyanin
VYIKDNSFLPDTVDVKVNTTVIFRNTDSIAHTIHCKGHATFPSLSVGPNRSASFEFDKPGRYEISAADMGDMRVSILSFSRFPCLFSLI